MGSKAMRDHRQFLRSLFDAAVSAADPARCVPPSLPPPPRGRTIVIGAGKASAAMAAAVEQHMPGPLSGLVITRYGHGWPCRRIEVIEAAHPVPDEQGRAAARRIAAMVEGLNPDDLVLCLISGGGSALLAAPAAGLTLADKQEVNRQLLASGAPIAEMNCLRKHLSMLKGGRLAARAYPARVVSLIISDVPGDDPAVIASGPAVADPTTSEEARAIIRKYGLDLPPRVMQFLSSPEAETPKPGDPRLGAAEVKIIATASQSLKAAARVAENSGWNVINLGDRVEGEARDVARMHAVLTAGPHAIILSGGETTVTVRGKGRGGRNTEYLLSLAIALGETNGRFAIAADTDGIDGSEDNAGAIVTPDTLDRATALGLDPEAYLANNDAYGFFEKLGDLVLTGPTRTNINDFRAMLT
ncbi:MAG TPA: glycerate kinase [Aestuariivirgaceae bacterium]|nr:glycerate kinase [Aestuariivirgaceae bacterium]